MKKRSHQETGAGPKAFQGDGFEIIFAGDYWLAVNPDDNLSGFILYNKLTGTYHARTSDFLMVFPKLAKAPYKTAEDCPVDENHNPKADLLMMLALRNRFKKNVPGSDFVGRSWRELAFQQRRREVEEKSGKPLSESNWAKCLKIAQSESKFEAFASTWLMALVCDDRASDNLIRLGKWLKHAEEIESEEISPHYSRFFAAVEEASRDAPLVVPCQKDVQKIYESGLSANQLGRGDGFRALMRHLHFDWLPAGPRGKAALPKKSGIR